jgi:hypothetical protein
MIANIVLDYTDHAPPLKSGAIKLDIDEHERQTCETPRKIIMSAHQWLWLLKESGLEAYARLPWIPVKDIDIVVGENTLWGVPVEVLES